MNIQGVGNIISDLGIDTVFLPFFLVFVVLFAILEKTKIFGTDPKGGSKKNINAIVALVFALVFISYLKLVLAVNNILPYIALTLVVIIMIGLVLGFFGMKLSDGNMGFVKIILGVIVLGIFGFSLNLINSNKISSFINKISDQIFPALLVVLLFFGVVWFLTREDNVKSLASDNKPTTSGKDNKPGGTVSATRNDIEAQGKNLKPGETKELGKL